MNATKAKAQEAERILNEAKGVKTTGLPVPARSEEIAKKGQEVIKKQEEAAAAAKKVEEAKPKVVESPKPVEKPAEKKPEPVAPSGNSDQEKVKLDKLLSDLDKTIAEGAAK